MIITIAEQFTGDPSDRERLPTIIWKPGLMITSFDLSQEIFAIHMLTALKSSLNKAVGSGTAGTAMA